MARVGRPTVWILGDQLNRNVASLVGRTPDNCRLLLVESHAKLASKNWHRQRLHLVISAMEHFAFEQRAEGFEVDFRQSASLSDGLREHIADHRVDEVVAMEPSSWRGRTLLTRLGVDVLPNNQFMCSKEDFAEWAQDRSSLRLEDFYRWQRRRFEVLMDGREPAGGRWNFDHENREPPPRDGRHWPEVERSELDEIDRSVLERLPRGWGSEPDGTWPVTRAQALDRLERFVNVGLHEFGPHEDAMLASEWKLAHSALSSSLNLGLLHPNEVVRSVVEAYEAGAVPINSAEGFIRQVLGWREYVWGVYWLWMPEYRDLNQLEAHQPLPPVLSEDASTDMGCVAGVLSHLRDRGYAHHIERLMVLGNLALTVGIEPVAMADWMWSRFVDAADWVMVPNVIGMALHADGGLMATKPYASGGSYINRMSDYCGDCRFDPRRRTGDKACPFTTLYWDFLARNESALARNGRMGRELAAMRRLKDLPDVKAQAVEIVDRLKRGEL